MNLLGFYQTFTILRTKCLLALCIGTLFLSACSLDAQLISPKDLTSVIDDNTDDDDNALPNPPASVFIPVEKVTTSNGYQLNTTISDLNENVTTSNGYTFKGVLYE